MVVGLNEGNTPPSAIPCGFSLFNAGSRAQPVDPQCKGFTSSLTTSLITPRGLQGCLRSWIPFATFNVLFSSFLACSYTMPCFRYTNPPLVCTYHKSIVIGWVTCWDCNFRIITYQHMVYITVLNMYCSPRDTIFCDKPTRLIAARVHIGTDRRGL